jgi:hypothetical protein
MRYTNGSTYVDTFACNGKPHLTPAGSMQTCTKGGPDSYSFTYTVNGKTIETDTDTISTDRNSLANIEHDVLPGGKTRTLTSVSTRVGAGTGLAGTWKTAKTTHSSRYTFALAATPTTLTYRSKTGGENYTLKFGGPSERQSGRTFRNRLNLFDRRQSRVKKARGFSARWEDADGDRLGPWKEKRSGGRDLREAVTRAWSERCVPLRSRAFAFASEANRGIRV